jgi:hypothetical protein
MLAPFKGHKDGLTREEYHWKYAQNNTRMCVERAFGMLKGRWRILLKRIDVQLTNVPDLVSTCLVLHNMCIIFGDTFWRTEWIQEVTDEVNTVMSHHIGACTSSKERMAVANNALQNLAAIDENAPESLEYSKQEAAFQFEIAMATGGKSAKELSARHNGIARNLWKAKTKICIAETFPMDID